MHSVRRQEPEVKDIASLEMSARFSRVSVARVRTQASDNRPLCQVDHCIFPRRAVSDPTSSVKRLHIASDASFGPPPTCVRRPRVHRGEHAPEGRIDLGGRSLWGGSMQASNMQGYQ